MVTGAVQFDVSREGTLAYVPEVPGFEANELVWINRAGAVEPLPVPAQAYWYPRLSPDEKQVVVSIGKSPVSSDLWSLGLERMKWSRLTYEQHCVLPHWSPSGTEIAYVSNARGFRFEVRAIEQDAVPRSIPIGDDQVSFLTGYHPDGSGVLGFYAGNPKSDIQFIPVDGASPQRAIAADDSAQWGGVMSPDGHWLAFVSNETGGDEVFVRSWSRPEAKSQVSRSGGTKPVWARDGKELFYTRGRKLVSVAVELRGPEFTVGPARELFDLPVTRGAPKQLANYDVSRDGQRFLTTRIADERAEIEHIDVVLGWWEELRRLVPTGK
jgi:serine/threonine-protein kinase